MPALTAKQTRFVEEFMVDLNASAAARRAGYSSRRADQQGLENLRKPDVAAAISARREGLAARAELRAAAVLQEIRRLAHSDIGNLMHADGRVKLPNELDPETRAAVKRFKIDELGRIEYEFWDKNRALDKAMRHLGLYEAHNEQPAGGLTALRAALVGIVVRPAPAATLPELDEGCC